MIRSAAASAWQVIRKQNWKLVWLVLTASAFPLLGRKSEEQQLIDINADNFDWQRDDLTCRQSLYVFDTRNKASHLRRLSTVSSSRYERLFYKLQ